MSGSARPKALPSRSEMTVTLTAWVDALSPATSPSSADAALALNEHLVDEGARQRLRLLARQLRFRWHELGQRPAGAGGLGELALAVLHRLALRCERQATPALGDQFRRLRGGADRGHHVGRAHRASLARLASLASHASHAGHRQPRQACQPWQPCRARRQPPRQPLPVGWTPTAPRAVRGSARSALAASAGCSRSLLSGLQRTLARRSERMVAICCGEPMLEVAQRERMRQPASFEVDEHADAQVVDLGVVVRRVFFHRPVPVGRRQERQAVALRFGRSAAELDRPCPRRRRRLSARCVWKARSPTSCARRRRARRCGRSARSSAPIESRRQHGDQVERPADRVQRAHLGDPPQRRLRSRRPAWARR